jgi:two-component system nitrogen regulation response regulator GlnG
MPKVLLIDDDADFSKRLCRLLEPEQQMTWLEAADAGALDRLAAGEFALVLLDNFLPKMKGIDFLQILEQRGVKVPVILVTSDDDPKTIIEAMNRGAFDYVEKRPTDALAKELKSKIALALEIWPQCVLTQAVPESTFQGRSPAMAEVYKQIGLVAKIGQPVLILGGPGSGKDHVARMIHAQSARRQSAFVVVRCNTFNDDLLRDELFGHEIGFRGEGRLRKGKFEYASGGTLYLDEVGELPRALQDDVLRVLEEQQVTRLGGNEPIPVDVRILAASRRDLHAIPESRLRRELLAQLYGKTIGLPVLRERLEDLDDLAQQLLAREAAGAGMKQAPFLHPDCLAKLRDHSWPGNIRELQLVLRRAVVHCRGPQILPRDLNFDEPDAEQQVLTGLRLAIGWALASGKNHLYGLLQDLLKQELVPLALQECGGDTAEAEKRLGVSLRDILHREDQPAPGSDPALPKDVERRIKALVLIQTYPDWTVDQYADKLKCSTATLYRDLLISRALELRKADRRLPHGHKSRDGSMEAYDELTS